MTARLLLDEHILDDGRVVRSWAILVGDSLRWEDDTGASLELPIAVLDSVMTRYGRELDSEVVAIGEVLDLPSGQRLQRLRYHAPVDAMPRDYLVWQRDRESRLAVLSTHAAAALKFVLTHVQR